MGNVERPRPARAGGPLPISSTKYLACICQFFILPSSIGTIVCPFSQFENLLLFPAGRVNCKLCPSRAHSRPRWWGAQTAPESPSWSSRREKIPQFCARKKLRMFCWAGASWAFGTTKKVIVTMLQRGSIIALMAVRTVEICECDVCHHQWIPRSGDVLPRRCASHRCKTMLWNHASRAVQRQDEPPRRRRASATDPAQRIPVSSVPASTEPDLIRAGAVRCERCKAVCINRFALRMHPCRP